TNNSPRHSVLPLSSSGRIMPLVISKVLPMSPVHLLPMSPVYTLPRDGGDVRGESLDSLVAANRCVQRSDEIFIAESSRAALRRKSRSQRAYSDFFVECEPRRNLSLTKGTRRHWRLMVKHFWLDLDSTLY